MSKNNMGDWAVVVGILQSSTKEPDKFVLKNYACHVKGHTARGAMWTAIEGIWAGAAEKKVIQPVFGATVLSWADYEKREKELDAAAAEKEREEAERQDAPPTPAEPEPERGIATEKDAP